MSQLVVRKVLFLSLLMGIIVPHTSFAMSSTKSVDQSLSVDSNVVELQRYFWYDGKDKRSVWVNPEWMAEFKVKTEGDTQLKSSNIKQKIKVQPIFVRFLEVGKEKISTQKNTDTIQYSPVFHSVKSTSGLKKSLPGNILIQMNPDWNQERIMSWFEAHGLTVIKPLTFAPNSFLIQSNAGLDALNMANRIYETGDVILASPNWWQERTVR